MFMFLAEPSANEKFISTPTHGEASILFISAEEILYSSTTGDILRCGSYKTVPFLVSFAASDTVSLFLKNILKSCPFTILYGGVFCVIVVLNFK